VRVVENVKLISAAENQSSSYLAIPSGFCITITITNCRFVQLKQTSTNESLGAGITAVTTSSFNEAESALREARAGTVVEF